jgi:hypothetical protein
LFALLFGVISLLYATVGQAGGTAFLALMAFAAFPLSSKLPRTPCAKTATWRPRAPRLDQIPSVALQSPSPFFL